MTVEPYAQEARRKMVESAHAMLNGRISFIEGARQINRLRWRAKIDDFDPDIIPFIAIDSETDALPLGEERERWLPEALVKMQPEIDQAETWAQELGSDACHKLIDRFGIKSE